MVAGYGTAGVDKLTGVSIHWTGPLDSPLTPILDIFLQF